MSALMPSQGRVDRPVIIRTAVLSALFLVNCVYAFDVFAIALAFPPFAICMIGLRRIRSHFVQIGDMFWFCIFIFFSIRPLQSLRNLAIGAVEGRATINYNVEEYVIATIIVMIFLLPFLFIRMEGRWEYIGRSPAVSKMLLVAICSFGLYVFGQGGLSVVLSPRLEQGGADTFIGSLAFLGVQIISTVILVAALSRKRSLAVVLAVLIAVTLLLIVRNPFNASRFSLLAAWLPVLLAFMGGRIRVFHFYVASIAGLMVLFPILNITTRVGVSGIDRITEIDFAAYFFGIQYIDVYDTLVHCVRYMGSHDYTIVQKTAAIVLFFVPRAIWPNKPIVGGLDIGQELYNLRAEGTANLSFFVGGDAYMDLGIIGVALYGVSFAWSLNWAMTRRRGAFFGQPVFHYVVFASLPILLRGPVGAVLPLFSMQVLAVVLLYGLSKGSISDKGVARNERRHLPTKREHHENSALNR